MAIWKSPSLNSASKVGAGVPDTLVRNLDQVGSIPPGMVRVPATKIPSKTLSDFFIGRYEVTNREYKTFVDAGGYQNRDYLLYVFY